MKGQPLPPDLGALAALGPGTPGLCKAVMGPGLEPPPLAPSLPTPGPGQAQPRSPATRDFFSQCQGVCDTCVSWPPLNVKLSSSLSRRPLGTRNLCSTHWSALRLHSGSEEVWLKVKGQLWLKGPIVLRGITGNMDRGSDWWAWGCVDSCPPLCGRPLPHGGGERMPHGPPWMGRGWHSAPPKCSSRAT